MKSICILKKSNTKLIESGFSSLLFILLVGMTFTVFTVGYMSSLKNMQSSAVTAHAQTQAQMQAMIGYQALSEFLKDDDLSLTEINSISSGTVTPSSGEIIQYRKSSNCPSGIDNYCFDIVGNSGGAKAILRALYLIKDEIKSQAVAGTIFAGGLVVGGSADFVGEAGETVKIYVGGENSGTVVDTSGKEVVLNNIEVNEFTGTLNVADAVNLRKYANYIFTQNSAGAMICYKNNLHSGSIDITTETLITCPSAGVSLKKGVWSFDSSKANLPGIIWFDAKVIIDLNSVPNDFINSILAVGSVETNLLDGQATYDAYSIYQYLLKSTDANIKSRLNKVCPADNYPVQYCQSYNSSDRDLITSMNYFITNQSKFIKDMDISPASLANILFLTDTGFAIDAANKATMNLYGNIVGTKGAGGTGSASGKITGTGDINIKGNIVVAGNLETEVLGSMTVTLGKTASSGNNIPIRVKSVSPNSINYQ